jgi:hypothetical protein
MEFMNRADAAALRHWPDHPPIHRWYGGVGVRVEEYGTNKLRVRLCAFWLTADASEPKPN